MSDAVAMAHPLLHVEQLPAEQVTGAVQLPRPLLLKVESLLQVAPFTIAQRAASFAA
jgi:hypothetical protein